MLGTVLSIYKQKSTTQYRLRPKSKIILTAKGKGGKTAYSPSHVLTLQPDYVSTLRGKTKNDTKTADRLQCILLN